MSRVIRRTKQLREDIIDIYAYIHQRSPLAAEKVFKAIHKSITALGTTPGVGRYWNSPDPRLDGLKVTTVRPHRNYLIFFRASATAVEVLRVVHGARDLQPLVDEIELDFDDEE